MGQLTPTTLPKVGVTVSEPKIIPTLGGPVLHCLKASDKSFLNFGEAYFSLIEAGCTKAWKMHRRMTMNLVVPHGTTRFFFIDSDLNHFAGIDLGPENYQRLTVPPGVWFGFQGLGLNASIVFNLSDIEHDPDEVQRVPLQTFNIDWSQQ